MMTIITAMGWYFGDDNMEGGGEGDVRVRKLMRMLQILFKVWVCVGLFGWLIVSVAFFFFFLTYFTLS